MNKLKRYLIIGACCVAVMGILSLVVVSKFNQSQERTPEQQKADQLVAQKEIILQQKQAENQKAQTEKEAKDLATWKTTPAGKLCAKHADWQKEDCDKLVANKVWIGMSYDMLVYLRGKPNTINPSNYGNGNEYQYCWTDSTPSCFYDKNDDGILDTYN